MRSDLVRATKLKNRLPKVVIVVHMGGLSVKMSEIKKLIGIGLC